MFLRITLLVCLILCASLCEAKKFMGPTDLFSQTFDEISVLGPCKLHQIHASKISIIGPLDFDQLEVKQEISVVGPVSGMIGKADIVDVTGPLNLRRFLCHNLNVVGPAQLDHVRVYCRSTLIGSIEAKSCRFEGLVITSDVCRFEDVETGDITFKNTSGKMATRLELIGHCVIHGKIHFESGNGLILVQEGQTDFEGPIEGATIVRSQENQTNKDEIKEDFSKKEAVEACFTKDNFSGADFQEFPVCKPCL